MDYESKTGAVAQNDGKMPSFVAYWLNIRVKGYVGDTFSLPHVSKVDLAIYKKWY